MSVPTLQQCIDNVFTSLSGSEPLPEETCTGLSRNLDTLTLRLIQLLHSSSRTEWHVYSTKLRQGLEQVIATLGGKAKSQRFFYAGHLRALADISDQLERTKVPSVTVDRLSSSLAMVQVGHAIQENHHIQLSELARVLGKESSNLSVLTTEMANLGLILREKRANTVWLSPTPLLGKALERFPVEPRGKRLDFETSRPGADPQQVSQTMNNGDLNEGSWPWIRSEISRIRQINNENTREKEARSFADAAHKKLSELPPENGRAAGVEIESWQELGGAAVHLGAEAPLDAIWLLIASLPTVSFEHIRGVADATDPDEGRSSINALALFTTIYRQERFHEVVGKRISLLAAVGIG